MSSASLAAGDLDGDGSAEIVAYGADGSTLAFTRKAGVWGLLWKSPYVAGIPGGPCNGANHRCPLGWAGPAIHDLDDDGVPEILREGAVLAADGTLRAPAPPGYASYLSGAFSVAANLDEDPAIETTNGQFIWEYQAGAWAQEACFPGASPSAPGHVAIADFGAYSAGVPASAPEIAVVRNNQAMVYARTGEPRAGADRGAGRGRRRAADDLRLRRRRAPRARGRRAGVLPRSTTSIAGRARAGRRLPGGHVATSPAVRAPAGGGIAWSRSTQDLSSNVTGSSVFDFEADGTAEVVYGDECFVRVYNGVTGDVLFSQYRSSCTWYENPIIADVDGNFPRGPRDPLEQGVRADGRRDRLPDARRERRRSAVPGSALRDEPPIASPARASPASAAARRAPQCCGAMDDAACLEEGYKCAPPPAGTPGAGDTCRAAHPHGVSGIRVYSDANDKWVRSRTIWNQHAYAVTHVNEDGTIPRRRTGRTTGMSRR